MFKNSVFKLGMNKQRIIWSSYNCCCVSRSWIFFFQWSAWWLLLDLLCLHAPAIAALYYFVFKVCIAV